MEQPEEAEVERDLQRLGKKRQRAGRGVAVEREEGATEPGQRDNLERMKLEVVLVLAGGLGARMG